MIDNINFLKKSYYVIKPNKVVHVLAPENQALHPDVP
jgi:hypothetical protein